MPKNYTIREVREAIELYPHTTAREIGEKLGRNESSVHKMLSRNGAKKPHYPLNGFHPMMKLERVLTMIQMMCGRKRTADELGRALQISSRTAFRYLNLLTPFGLIREGKYYSFKSCPFCGHTTNNHH